MPPRRSILLLVALILLVGCTGRTPRSEESVRRTIIAAAPTVTPAPWETVRPAKPTALPTPDLPTVTPFATPPPQAGIFTDAAIGFQLNYPLGWNSSAAAIPGTLVQLANQPNDVFLVILRTVRDEEESFEDDAASIQRQISDWLGGFVFVDSATSTTNANVPTWQSEYRLPLGRDTYVSLMTSVEHGAQLITLVAYGEEQYIARDRQVLENIFASMQLTEPQIYGVPRNAAYIYAEEEPLDPQTHDPATGSGDHLVFSGLLRFAPDLTLQPDLAASWSLSADGLTYTFFLRRDVRFHDGRRFTAQDVLYSWERAANPELASPTVLSYLGDIEGVRERWAGEAETISGLSAPDDYSIQVQLVAPRPAFLLKLTGGAALVVDQANVQMGPTWYTQPNGTGPYRLSRWETGRIKIYERYPKYYGMAPLMPYVIARLDVGYSGVYQYMLDDVDQIDLSAVEQASIADIDQRLHSEMRAVPQMCTSFVAFDTSRPPFDDPKVRQAFALAVDRQRYQERVLRGQGILAHGLYPPAMPGYNADLQGTLFNPDLARQRLGESAYAGELPDITLTSVGNGLYVEPGVGVLVQMWQEVLGATIKIEQLEPASYAERITASDRGNLFFREWCASYPDPTSFADTLFGSDSPQNLGRYHNADLDGLLASAAAATALDQRTQSYQQAESLIIDDAAAIFLNHRVDTMLVAPNVQGVVRAPFNLPVEPFIQLEQ